MRVGGPYSVTVAYTGTAGTAFEPQTQEDVTVNLGVATDLTFKVRAIAVQETVTVTATVDPVFSSSRTGAATAVSRADIATLPTLTGRIGDITRLTPQASGSSFAGQDNRLNNMTVDGSYFNNSFGLGGQPGDRTGVAPISLESIEQMQVSVAPFDVRQGSFIGAGVNTVTRSGTNQFTGSFYHRLRNEDFVGTEAHGPDRQSRHVHVPRHRRAGPAGRSSRTSCSCSATTRTRKTSGRCTTFRANTGGEPVGGSVTRVLASDLTALSAFLQQNFQLRHRAASRTSTTDTPAKRYLLRTDYNLNNTNKISFRYNQLDSSSDNYAVQLDVGAASAAPTSAPAS